MGFEVLASFVSIVALIGTFDQLFSATPLLKYILLKLGFPMTQL